MQKMYTYSMSIVFFMNFIFACDSSSSNSQNEFLKSMPNSSIRIAQGSGAICVTETINLEEIDAIVHEPFIKIAQERWDNGLPWILAAVLSLNNKNGLLWRTYYDVLWFNRWLLSDEYEMNNVFDPLNRFEIITVDYLSLESKEKEFIHLGTFDQLRTDERSVLRLLFKADIESDVEAMDEVGVFLYSQKKDVSGACQWFKKGAQKGSIYSMLNILDLYAHHRDSIVVTDSERNHYISQVSKREYADEVHSYKMGTTRHYGHDRWNKIERLLNRSGP
jgi:hypothetical protein